MILVIAEKPSLARDIADALPGARRNEKNYIAVGDYCVTWAFGHLLEMKAPEDIDPTYADRNNLDILPLDPKDWGLKVRASEDGSVADRVSLIGNMLQSASYVIHAGDPDDEGQLLIDELLRWHGYKGRVMRLDTGNTTKDALERALKNMVDNKERVSDGYAADARRIADYMVGLNLSRFFSAMNNANLPVGRVKCPTLGLVVTRDQEIASHQKSFYYKVKGSLRLQNGALIDVEFIPDEADPNLTDGKILQRSYAEQVQNAIEHIQGIANVSKSDVISKPPLPFNLVALQSFCSKKFGYQPGATLDITQSLRDKYKAITYNRTDCQYLSDEHFKEAPMTTSATLSSLGVRDPGIDTSIKSRCFNSKKIKTHFAIIPSGKIVDINQMTAQERNVYTAIAQFYLAQFMQPAKKERTVLQMPLPLGGMLRAVSTEVIVPGFLALEMLGGTDEDGEEKTSVLSKVPESNYGAMLENSEVKDCETKPKPHYTPATLIVDMTRIARYVDDPTIREILIRKDEGDDSVNGCIGTDATRTIIVNDLLTQGYCEMRGKHIVSTVKGQEFYRILPDEFKKADLTANWWLIQEEIKNGSKKVEDLTDSVLNAISDVLMQEFPKLDTSKFGAGSREPLGSCPICHQGDVLEGKSGYYCSKYDAQNNGCKFYIPKESNTGILSRTPITPAVIKKLLAGKPVYVNTLWTKKQQQTEGGEAAYGLSSGKISLNTDPSSPFLLKATFEREPLGACPKCKTGTILEGKFAYGCSNWNADPPCNFRIRKKPNPDYPDSILSRLTVTKTMAKQLLSGKTVNNVTLWSSRKQSEYMGEVGLIPDENGEIHLGPVFREYGDVIGTCPRCGGTITETKFGYRCSNFDAGCRYQIWKTAKQGIMSRTVIQPDVAQRLILGEKVQIKGLYSASKNKKFTGTIYLDDSKKGEYGPDIKLLASGK